MELQIKGKDIQNLSEKFIIPVNNPSNIVSHTTMLVAAASEAAAGNSGRHDCKFRLQDPK